MKRKSICFVVATPFTALAFLKKHINELAKFYDVYLVANFEGFDESHLQNIGIKGLKHVAIARDIKLNKDIGALLSLKKYFKKMQFVYQTVRILKNNCYF